MSLLLGMIKHARSTQSDKFPIYLQYLRKEVKNEVYFLHADKHQKFLQVGIAGFDRSGQICPSTKNRKLIISLQYIKKIVSQLLLYSIVMQNIQPFYGGSAMFIVSCFFAQSDCRDFLPEHCTTIIKQQLCRRSFHLCCLCSKLTFFKRSRVCCSKSNYDHQTSQKKFVSGFVIQIIPLNVLHECTTILQLKFYIDYVVRKLVWHLGVLSIWLYSFFHLSAMEDPRIIRGFFSIFPHKVSHHKVRKLMDLSFWKKVQIGLA